MAFSVARRYPLEAVSLSSGSGAWWWWWRREWKGGVVEEGEEKVCSGESRCRPLSQRNFDGGSDAPVGETLSHFLRVSSQSDGGFSPFALPPGVM